MKNLKWMTLILAVIFAAGSSFKAARKKSKTGYTTYSVVLSAAPKFYIGRDITSETEGVDYTCSFPPQPEACKVESLNPIIHSDANGNYLDTGDPDTRAYLGHFN